MIRSAQISGAFGEFPHTDWSLVRAVQCVDAADQREVLGRFLEEYLPAFRAYLYSLKYFSSSDDNEDLLGDFVADKLIAEELLTKVRQEVGLLRTFLKTCLHNFACSKLRKRGPVELGGVAVTENKETEPSAPGMACPFDLEWARNVVARVIALTHEDCVGTDPSKPDQPHVWAVFEGRFVLPITGQGGQPTPYEQLMEELGADSIKQVQNWLVTGQRKFENQIMRVIREYAPTEARAKQEVRDLFAILSQASAIPFEVEG